MSPTPRRLVHTHDGLLMFEDEARIRVLKTILVGLDRQLAALGHQRGKVKGEINSLRRAARARKAGVS